VRPAPVVRSRPLAGGAIAAIVLVATIGVAALLAIGGGSPSSTAPSEANAPTTGVTAAPAATQPNGGDGGGGGGNGNKGGKGGGNGGGKGH
jgi:hypothetical protein